MLSLCLCRKWLHYSENLNCTLENVCLHTWSVEKQEVFVVKISSNQSNQLLGKKEVLLIQELGVNTVDGMAAQPQRDECEQRCEDRRRGGTPLTIYHCVVNRHPSLSAARNQTQWYLEDILGCMPLCSLYKTQTPQIPINICGKPLHI